jgi:hypothetical protein
MKHSVALLLAICLVGCKPFERERAIIDLKAGVKLLVYQTVRNGFGDGSVYTSLSLKWPNAPFSEHVGQSDFFEGTEDIRLIELPDRYLLIYGPSIYHKSRHGGTWTQWRAVSNYILPPYPLWRVICANGLSVIRMKTFSISHTEAC